MYYRLLLNLLVISFLLVIYSNSIIIDQGYEISHPSVWNYNYSQIQCPLECSINEQCGPNCWYHIKSLSNQCNNKYQSPINIVQVESDHHLEYPSFQIKDPGCNHWTQFASNHAFKVSFSEEDNLCDNQYFLLKNEKYVLEQLHFHSPSEHILGGGYAAAEVHLVHRNMKTNQFIVLGILINTIKSSTSNKFDQQGNNFLKIFLEIAENKNSNKNDLYSHKYKVTNYTKYLNTYKEFLPASREYYTYMGSLTTYPCTENIQWIIFSQDILISSKDLVKLKNSVAMYPNTLTLKDYDYSNNRPIQELNNRKITMYIQ